MKKAKYKKIIVNAQPRDLLRDGLIHKTEGKLRGIRGISYKPRRGGKFDPQRLKYLHVDMYVTPEGLKLLREKGYQTKKASED